MENLEGNEQEGTSSPMAQDKNLDYLCPICFELITEVIFHQNSLANTFSFFTGTHDAMRSHILLRMPPPDN